MSTADATLYQTLSLRRQSMENSAHHIEVAAKDRRLAFAILAVCLAAFTAQTELAQVVQKDRDFHKPYFLLYIGHSCYILLLPLHLVFSTIRNTLASTHPHRAVLLHLSLAWTDYVDSFWESLTALYILRHPQTQYHIAIPQNDVVSDSPMEEDDSLPTFPPINALRTFCITLSIALAIFIMLPAYTWYAAVGLIPMATLTAINNTSCFFAYVFSIFMLGDNVEVRKVAAVAISIAGVFIMAFWNAPATDIPDDLNVDRSITGGVFIAALSAAFYGFYEVFYKRYCSPPVPSFVFANSLTTAVGVVTVLLLWIPIPLLHYLGIEPFALPSWTTFGYILLVASMGLLFNASFMCVIAITNPLFASIAVMLTIPLVALCDMIVTGQAVTLDTVVGSCLIVVAFGLLDNVSGSMPTVCSACRRTTPLYTPLLLSTAQKRFAGHNKWSKVKHTKGGKDAKRAQLFSKLSLEIISAIKSGGPELSLNARLSAALAQARTSNMPKESIENAIKKATGADKDALEDVLFEGYGPNGIAFIVETVTDKRMRTIKEVRDVLTKYGGSLTSVQWLFDKKGRIEFAPAQTEHDVDAMMESAIEAGAEDMEATEDDTVEILCDYANLNTVTQSLAGIGYEILKTEIAYIPTSTTAIEGEEMEESFTKCLEALENLSDVAKVHSNAE
ncbi:hypothetical protein BZG36_02265 [Bifiguratus adelaidae]|uniref:Transcriptional regulatory protein n=1 Tax=Bifiguratus adelaidae TaxID=1938954 RepID=A0A261XY67_9FUNG|nr:hypothetical protein BZG36_02265 [Bifiguratus adelaidae]